MLKAEIADPKEPCPDVSDAVAVARHVEHVQVVAESRLSPSHATHVLSSWQRCVNIYGLDPAGNRAPELHSSSRLREHREPIERLIVSARDEIDRLYGLVRDAGYTLYFCNTEGVAVEQRCRESDARELKRWGAWLGSVWSEAHEGTNGVGTCIAEERPVTIHRNQHFRSRHIGLSCSGAPIFGVDGRMLAVLDVSAVDPRSSEPAHALTGPLTIHAAHAIEARFFREQFEAAWIVSLRMPEQDVRPVLLAVDRDQRILGANRAARTALSIDDHALEDGADLCRYFERDRKLFHRYADADIATRLVLPGSGVSCPAIITAPKKRSGAWFRPGGPARYPVPRGHFLRAIDFVPAPHVRGGLPPRALHRVRKYVETNLKAELNLAAMASVAGVSLSHFARAFKRSSGETPHRYVLRRRVERARELLAATDLPLSDIALAVGFSDQSHLARCFRQQAGLSPGEFRRSQR